MMLMVVVLVVVNGDYIGSVSDGVMLVMVLVVVLVVVDMVEVVMAMVTVTACW